MEYKVKDENGLMVWYKLTGTSVVPSKVSFIMEISAYLIL